MIIIYVYADTYKLMTHKNLIPIHKHTYKNTHYMMTNTHSNYPHPQKQKKTNIHKHTSLPVQQHGNTTKKAFKPSLWGEKLRQHHKTPRTLAGPESCRPLLDRTFGARNIFGRRLFRKLKMPLTQKQLSIPIQSLYIVGL